MIDSLPEGSKVVNFAARKMDYALFGSSLQNRIVDFIEASRILGSASDGSMPDDSPEVGRLASASLRKLGATHILTSGKPILRCDECVSLRQIDEMDKDPSGAPMEKILTLYEVNFCGTPSSGFELEH
jgi:hypothetical protein